MLLTRTPLYLPCGFLVRLACVRRAASVDSEPGSNSRLKPVASPTDGGSDIVSQSLDFPLEDEIYTYTLNQIVKELVLSGTLQTYRRNLQLVNSRLQLPKSF